MQDEGTHAERLNVLSVRAREVLRLMCAGMVFREIATERGMSPFAVRCHAANLYAKLGLAHRSAEVRRNLLKQLGTGLDQGDLAAGTGI